MGGTATAAGSVSLGKACGDAAEALQGRRLDIPRRSPATSSA